MIRIRPWLLLLAAPLLLSARAAGQPPPTFSDLLSVREREILIDLPDTLEDNRLKPEDFQVLVDGQPWEVTRAAPLFEEDGAGPWTLLIYVDRTLARPGTVFYSGLALANRARALTSLGTVEVAVAGSDPATVLAPTREARQVEGTLTDLAAEARVERDRTEGRTAADGELKAEGVRRQLDKLLDFLSARRSAGPHALFLVADGFGVSPEQAILLSSGTPADGPSGLLPATIQRTARLLAAYGWVTIVLPLRKEGLGLQQSKVSDIDRMRVNSRGPGEPPVILVPPKPTTLVFPGVIDLFIKPETAALRPLAQATTGTVIGFEEQLDPALDALTRRWRLWIAEPEAPLEEAIQTLAVRLPGNSKAVRAPEWIRFLRTP